MKNEERKELMQTAEMGEAVEAGIQLKRAQEVGEYAQGVADGVLLKFDAIRRMISGPKATA